ncbi:MAG: sensor histidine kinase [Alphaproteobacteria bacterium]|nr:sensor histidine kinase [Alphaproteobacteria bacterium]
MGRHFRDNIWLRDARAHCTLKVGFLTLLCSSTIWGTISICYALSLVLTYNNEQERSFAEKSEKWHRLLHAAQVSLSLADEKDISLGMIFKRTENALRNHFEKFNVTYSLTIIDTRANGQKVTKYGFSVPSPVDLKFISPPLRPVKDYFIFDRQSNPILVRQLYDFEGKVHMLLSISNHSLGKYLQIDRPEFIHSSTARELTNSEHETFHIPLDEDWFLTYHKGKTTFLDEFAEYIFAYRFFLLLAIAITATILAAMYVYAAYKIENGFRLKLRAQEQDIQTMTQQLKEKVLALDDSKQELLAMNLQKSAVYNFLLEIEEDIKQKGDRAHALQNESENVSENIDVPAITKSVLNCFEMKRVKKKLDVQLLSPEVAPFFRGNRIALKEIIYNLVSRAFSNATTKIHITIEQADDEKLAIVIYDDGYRIELESDPPFSDKSELSIVTMSWDKLMTSSGLLGISFSRIETGILGNCIRLEARSNLYHQTHSKDSNVVPFR